MQQYLAIGAREYYHSQALINHPALIVKVSIPYTCPTNTTGCMSIVLTQTSTNHALAIEKFLSLMPV